MPISFPIPVRTLKVKSGDKKRVYYPHIFGTRSKALENMVNGAIVEETQGLMDQQVGGMPSTVEEAFRCSRFPSIPCRKSSMIPDH